VENILELKNITKRFPGVVANDDISLDIRSGEIHALVGENGSGKSTLMNILYGLYQADEGEIHLRGEKASINYPRQAIDLGIGMVFQHFMLVEPLTVFENVILGEELHKNGFIDFKRAEKEVSRLSREYGLRVEPGSRVEDISVGQQQRLEILKALYRKADILILDEPTAVLTPQETEELFQVMRNLKKQGTTIIFITHKIKEVLAVSDRVSVLRRGKLVGTRDTEKTDRPELAEMMVGREVLLRVEKEKAQPGEKIFSVSDLQVRDQRGTPRVKGVSLEIHSGEILGVAGVEGNGQQEMVEAITGLLRTDKGKVVLEDKELQNLSAMQVKKKRMGYIPEDRHKRGLILDFDVADNMILGLHTEPPFVGRFFLRDEKAIKDNARELVEEFDVRPPNIQQQVSTFSGGNQQKIVAAREISRRPRFLICSQPTRGLDIGAIEFIHSQIIEQRDKGAAILLVSAELDEILSLSDRIVVMYEGRIVGSMPAEEANEKKLGSLMLGGEAQADEGGDKVETGTE